MEKSTITDRNAQQICNNLCDDNTSDHWGCGFQKHDHHLLRNPNLNRKGQYVQPCPMHACAFLFRPSLSAMMSGEAAARGGLPRRGTFATPTQPAQNEDTPSR